MTGRFLRILLLVLVSTACVSQSIQVGKTQSDSVEVMPLYKGAIPGALGSENTEHIRDVNHADTFIMDVSQPTLTAYLPDQSIANGTAVIILPGGGYSGVSIVKEGYQVAERFNSLGIAAFVLKYRMPSNNTMADKTTGPLQDAQQAISLVRANSQKWHINPNKVGIMGFSAGGHLAASAAVHYNNPVNPQLANKNLRPDFQILIYPVISFDPQIGHLGSRDNLIGPDADSQLVTYFSSETQVNAATPPAYLVHAGDDKAVPVENSLVYYQALHQHGVPAQLLIVPSGGHGFGMRNPVDWFAGISGWLSSL